MTELQCVTIQNVVHFLDKQYKKKMLPKTFCLLAYWRYILSEEEDWLCQESLYVMLYEALNPPGSLCYPRSLHFPTEFGGPACNCLKESISIIYGRTLAISFPLGYCFDYSKATSLPV